MFSKSILKNGQRLSLGATISALLTSYPCSIRSCTQARPSLPLPPVTTIRFIVLFSLSAVIILFGGICRRRSKRDPLPWCASALRYFDNSRLRGLRAGQEYHAGDIFGIKHLGFGHPSFRTAFANRKFRLNSTRTNCP